MKLTNPNNLWYTEFIAAAIEKRFFLSTDRRRLMFQYFDLDNKESISVENIKETCARRGVDVSSENVKRMISEIEPSANLTQISQDMFMNLMEEGNFIKEHSHSENLSKSHGSTFGKSRSSVMQLNALNEYSQQKNRERTSKKSLTAMPHI